MPSCRVVQVYLKISRLVLTYLEVNLKLLQSKGNSRVTLGLNNRPLEVGSTKIRTPCRISGFCVLVVCFLCVFLCGFCVVYVCILCAVCVVLVCFLCAFCMLFVWLPRYCSSGSDQQGQLPSSTPTSSAEAPSYLADG